MRKVHIISLLTLILPSGLLGQNIIGKWTSYLPYNQGRQIAISGNKVFCSTEGGLFYYDTADRSIHKLSREDGLSDSDISAIAASEETGQVIIAYSNANIDILEGNRIFNLADILRKLIVGDKRINSVCIKGSRAYLSTGFGVVVLDLARKEISETYLIGPQGSQVKVNDVAIFGNTIFAATETGLLRAALDSPNLIDFNSWTLITDFTGSIGPFNTLHVFDQKLFANRQVDGSGDQLFQFDGMVWSLYPHLQNFEVYDLGSGTNEFFINTEVAVFVFNKTGDLLRLIESGSPRQSLMDQSGQLWIADRNKGLILSSQGSEMEIIKPEGPSARDVVSMAHNGKFLAGVAGGTTSNLANLYRHARLYTYDGLKWGGYTTDSIRDLVKVVFQPEDPNRMFIGTWGYGVMEFQNEQVLNVYNETNSTLRTIIPGPYIRCGGIAFDSQKNMWVSNSGVEAPLSVRKKDGTWKSFEISSYVDAPNMGDILITRTGHIWIILPGGRGLFVYNTNGTIDNTDDDSWKKLSVTDRDNKIITNDIYAISEDRDGNIWMGTARGVVVYYSPSRVFSDGEFYAQQIIVPRNDGSGFGDVLLGEEVVTSVAVDGANRKWLGTRNGGVFLVSDDGLKQIHAFNTLNSPLLSNSITSIALHPGSGEVFFGTNNGIISYISDATQPDNVFSDVFVYPNPVRENYEGPVVISGLIEDTWIKITDMNGNLVHETKSLGGQAIWDGKNLKGDRVMTGVYLVFCTNDDGSQTHITKLLFIH